jgi:hypothetical protein
MNADTDLPVAPLSVRAIRPALLLIVAGAAGLVAGAVLARAAAGLLADGLDLGQAKDRFLFAYASSLIGAPTGMAGGLWLALRMRRASIWRSAAGFVVGLGVAALAAFGFVFAVVSPPPPVVPYLQVEVRIAPAGEPLRSNDTRLTLASGRDGRAPTESEFGRDGGGRNMVRATFALPRQGPVDHLMLSRRGLGETRFSLNLPSDPPSTADFTQWLSSDRAIPGAEDERRETIEMRFRIDRRVLR